MDLQLNADRFSGTDFVELYDQYRPSPPEALLNQSLNYLGRTVPRLVVDLGCGTGISTLIWKDRAEQVIGIEPSADMIAIANKKINGSIRNVKFVQAFSNQVPVEDGMVDMVTCSQSFHWMDPESTLREVSRLLRKDGLFVIYDCDWPPSFTIEMEEAYQKLFEKVDKISANLNTELAIRWAKSQHLQNVTNSQLFRFVKATGFHKEMNGGKRLFEGLALSQGGLQALLKRGYSLADVGFDAFKATLEMAPVVDNKITFHYKAIFAVK